MINRPLVLVSIFFAAGIALGLYVSIPVIVGGLGGLFLISLIQAIRKRSFTLPLLLIFLAVGALAYNLSLEAVRGNIREFAGERGTLVGYVAGEPMWRKGEVVFPLEPEVFNAKGEDNPARGQVRVVLTFDEEQKPPAIYYGQQLSLTGNLYEPAGQRNPGGFDYRFFLERQGIAATFYTSQGSLEDLGLAEGASSWQRFVHGARSKVQQLIDSSLPPREASLLRGIFLGERSAVDEGLVQAFQRSGAAHLMAVSGLHVGLLAALLWGLGRRFSLKGWPAYLALLGIVFAYVAITGMRPATLRAFLMLAVAAGALHWDRKNDLPTALAFAALVTLFINPLLLFDIGFQLSYAATIAIIALAGPLTKALSFLPPYIKEIVAVSLAAQLGVLPFSAYYFNQFSLVALVVNLLIIPIMPFVVGLAFLGSIIGFALPFLASIILAGAYPLLLYMSFVVTLLSSLPGAYLEVHGVKEWHIFLLYSLPLLIYLIIYYLKNEGGHEELLLKRTFLSGKRVVVVGLIFLVLAVSIFYPVGYNKNELDVVFLDVGQGDAVFLKTPDGYTVLIDGGGGLSYRGNLEWPGERVILPFLRWQGIDNLDVVMISHPHEDHFGGLFPVFREKEVGLVIISPYIGESASYNELMNLLEELDISREMAKKGDILRLGEDVIFSFYSPGERLFRGTNSDANNNSLIKKMIYDEISILFTGDIEEDAVLSLLREEYSLESDILKVPHHGGHFASVDKFLQAVSPAIGVICVGNNNFGHPNPAILESLHRHGVDIYRTDSHGAVTVKSDGKSFSVEPFVVPDTFHPVSPGQY